MELTEVKGIGPATAIKLKSAGINTADDLAKSSIEDVIAAGIGKPTATKIVTNAKDVVGTSSKEEKPKKAPKKTSKKQIAKEDKKDDIKPIKIPISYVKGVGPKTRKTLEDAKITFAKDLASKSVEEIVELGIGKAIAGKIIANAVEQIGVLPEDKDAPAKAKKKKVEEKPSKKVSKEKPPKKVKTDKKKTPEPVAEHERSPAPQGIPTKKKRGVQVRRTDIDDESEVAEQIEKPVGWGVQAKELSKDEIEKRKARQDEIARSRQITRPIPLQPKPVKAKKVGKVEKGDKPQKVDKTKKKVKLSRKKKVSAVEYFTQTDVHEKSLSARKRGISGKSGTAKPRISLERNTRLGRISSHRRSRRVIHEKQLIVKLENSIAPDQLSGQKVYFVYPETTKKIPGSVSKRFGKATSGKVLVNFKKGIRMEALNQSIFIK
ncbi:MAG: helix-hairpin-helix domain-containing protein [Candidatus Kariarchaeaceae archaeon]|jgi:ribosomal protein L35AE/L33A/predicted flap endonuclease-1-like 5' DNA nuclease